MFGRFGKKSKVEPEPGQKLVITANVSNNIIDMSGIQYDVISAATRGIPVLTKTLDMSSPAAPAPAAPVEETAAPVEEAAAPVEEAASGTEAVVEEAAAPVEEAGPVSGTEAPAPVEEASPVSETETSAPVEEVAETKEEPKAETSPAPETIEGPPENPLDGELNSQESATQFAESKGGKTRSRRERALRRKTRRAEKARKTRRAKKDRRNKTSRK